MQEKVAHGSFIMYQCLSVHQLVLYCFDSSVLIPAELFLHCGYACPDGAEESIGAA